MAHQIATLADLELDSKKEFHIVEEICEWERAAYGDGLHRVPHKFIECVKKNRTGFVVAMSGDDLIGYADLWQLQSHFYSRLRTGEADEESLAEQHVLSPADARSDAWYVGSMIISEQFRSANRIASVSAFTEICRQLPKILHRHSNFPASILGVGSICVGEDSSFGAKLFTSWGFAPVVAAEHAIDTRPRYEKQLRMMSDTECFSFRSKQSGRVNI